MNYVGYPSAAALGFITGGTRGAYVATKLYQSYANMPHRRNPNTRRTRTPSAATAQRQRESRQQLLEHIRRGAAPAYTPRIAGARSSAASTTIGTTLRLPRVTKRERQPRVKKRKSVNVSKSFRLKTQKVIAEKQVTGIYITDQIEVIRCGIAPNVQDWEMLPNKDHPIAGMKGDLFGLTRVVAAASRCWNKKAPSRTPGIGDSQMFGSATDNSKLSNYKFDVRAQWWEFNLKNNTHKTLNVRIHQCGHKKYGNYDDPLDLLNEGIIHDFLEGNTISSINGVSGVLNDRTTLIKPELVTSFKNQYSTKTIAVVLEPGQEYTFKVEGPAMVYDAKKFFSTNNIADVGPIYNTKQKNDMSLMWQVTTDMGGGYNAAGSTNAYGLLPIPWTVGEGGGASRTHVLVVRARYHCKLLMPEQVGFDKSSIPSGSTQNLELRKDVRVLDDYKQRDALLFVNQQRVDVVEPTQEV